MTFLFWLTFVAVCLFVSLWGQRQDGLESGVLVIFEELTDFVNQYAFEPGEGCTRPLEDEESGHGRHLKQILDLVTLIDVNVDEEIFLAKLFGKSRHVVPDALAGTAPSGRNLTECFLVARAHDKRTELSHVLRIFKRHDGVLVVDMRIFLGN